MNVLPAYLRPKRCIRSYSVGLLTPSNAPVFTHPPELSRQLPGYKIDLDRFIDKTPHVDSFDPAITAPTLALVQEFREMELQRAKVCFSLMDSEPWDFFMVVFTATDRMGHYLWPFHRAPQAGDARHRPVILQLVGTDPKERGAMQARTTFRSC